MKCSGYVLTRFDKPDFTEGIDNLAKQAQDVLVFCAIEEQVKLAVQGSKRCRSLFQQAQNVRAGCRQEMRFSGVGYVNDALVIPASFQKSG